MATIIIGLYYPRPRNHIRLLNILPDRDGTIECILEAVDLKRRPLYNALYHTCDNPPPDLIFSIKEAGTSSSLLSRILSLFRRHPSHKIAPPSTQKPSIFINGIRRAVSPSLYTLLLRLSEPDLLTDIPIWVDEVCVNQGDVVERAEQVAMVAWNARSAGGGVDVDVMVVRPGG
ncbi:uncharacterized protein CLAFUR5_14030 [Fulvia fulva]|uniref:Heterokaryon incompatibility domain-containing protein n=1 Tax=Passalora fulva TaxID=5499 RepID=A0A9Q8UW69_PASFU|nr:uncharacterized protein CLAFUR5_14030 [Fulvia fulva]KAK4611210.1 hypothetical protein CLAFUR0_14205 [Fulvia fulva]UJO24729.1 hypothetical protein CLAFUR5_14030 [Fulvia fulva]